MKLVYRFLAGTAVAVAIVALIGFSSTTTFADPGVKAVICHATGSASNPYTGNEVGIQEDGMLANNGHLDANGSPLDGHEHDIFLGHTPDVRKQDCNKLPPPK